MRLLAHISPSFDSSIFHNYETIIYPLNSLFIFLTGAAMVITDRYEWDLIDWLHVLYHINIHDDTRTGPSFQDESVTIVQENNIKAFKKLYLVAIVLQEKCNSSALAIYLSLSFTNPSIYHSERKMHDIHFSFWITYINNIHIDIIAIHRWMYKQKYQPIRR